MREQRLTNGSEVRAPVVNLGRRLRGVDGSDRPRMGFGNGRLEGEGALLSRSRLVSRVG